MFGQHRGRHKHANRASAERAETLAALRPGQDAVITRISDDIARAQALRFGMGVGASVVCTSVLPGGPVIVRSGRQEIAVGRALAGRIGIRGTIGGCRECA